MPADTIDRTKVDVHIVNHGSIVTFLPCSQAAKDWIKENVHAENHQWLGANLCVEHRFAEALIEALQAEGLVVA
jgi:hypothetical protein